MSSDVSAASRLQRWVRKRINGLRSSAPPTPSSPRPSPPTKAPPSRPWQRLAQRAAAPMGASTAAANTEVPVSAPGSGTPQSQATGRVRSNGRQAATPLQAREQPTQGTATSATTSNFGGNADADAATDEHDSAPAGGTSSVFSVARMAQRMLGRRSGARAWASEAKKTSEALDGLGLLQRKQTNMRRGTAARFSSFVARARQLDSDEIGTRKARRQAVARARWRTLSGRLKAVAALIGMSRAAQMLAAGHPAKRWHEHDAVVALRRTAAANDTWWAFLNGAVLLYNWLVVTTGAAIGPMLRAFELEDELLVTLGWVDALADTLTVIHLVRYLAVAVDIEELALASATANRTEHNVDFEAWHRREREASGNGGMAWWWYRGVAQRLVACTPWQLLLNLARLNPAMPGLAASQTRALARIPRLLLSSHYLGKMARGTQHLAERTLGPVATYFLSLAYYGFVLTHIVACAFLFLASVERWQYQEFYGITEASHGPLAAYVSALWWAWSAMTSGNVSTPVTTLEVVFTFLVSVLGLFLFAQLVNAVGQLTEASDVRAIRYRNRMDEVTRFCHTNQLPAKLRHRLFTYYNTLFERLGGFQSSSMEDTLGDLPSFMQTEVSMHLYAKFLLKVGFVSASFARDEQQTLSFVKALVRCVTPQLILAGDQVVSKGDIGDEMFFIVKGQVSIVLDGGVVVATLGQGSNFGENACLFSERRTATVVATELCEVLTLHRDAVAPLLAQFPVVQSCAQEAIDARKAARSKAVSRVITKTSSLRRVQSATSSEGLGPHAEEQSTSQRRLRLVQSAFSSSAASTHGDGPE